MKKFITICSIMLVMALSADAAVTIPCVETIDFTEVDLGSFPIVNLSDQFADYGVIFEDVYRYIDDRDPFGDDHGISNGVYEDQLVSATLGTVHFTNPTSFVMIDWWLIAGPTTQLIVEVYDSSDNLLDSFATSAAVTSGTETLMGSGLISYMTFTNHGGQTQIANITFAPIPAPGAVLLGGIGVVLVGWLRRRRAL